MNLNPEVLRALAVRIADDPVFARSLRVAPQQTLERVSFLTAYERGVMMGNRDRLAAFIDSIRGGGSAAAPIFGVGAGAGSADIPTTATFVTGSINKISQLTGDFDLQRNRPTLGLTQSRYQLSGTDLGASFEHDGRIYFLFGDSVPVDPRGYGPGSDAIGWVPKDALSAKGVALNLLSTSGDGASASASRPERFGQFSYAEPWVFDDPNMEEARQTRPGDVAPGVFEVPTGGFSADLGSGLAMYVFSTINATPPPYLPGKVFMRNSVLVKSHNGGVSFKKVLDVSSDKIIYVCPQIADVAHVPGLPFPRALLMFASGRHYRRSFPYLACAPLDSRFESDTARSRWLYWTGSDWSSDEGDAFPLFVERDFDPSQGVASSGGCGEVSVAYNRFLQKWMMFYNYDLGSPTIRYRCADWPWGPWVGPAGNDAPGILAQWYDAGPLFDSPEDPQGMKAGMNFDDLVGLASRKGALYAASFVPYWFVGDYTTSLRSLGSSRVVFTISSWNPYQVHLMSADFLSVPTVGSGPEGRSLR